MFYHPTKLTTVKVLTDKYTAFKVSTVNDEGITLQALVNRAIYLYQTDTDFRKKIDTTLDLKVSGSLL